MATCLYQASISWVAGHMGTRTHPERGLLRPQQREMSTADWFCTVKPIIVGPRSNKYTQCFFPERTRGDKYYEL